MFRVGAVVMGDRDGHGCCPASPNITLQMAPRDSGLELVKVVPCLP